MNPEPVLELIDVSLAYEAGKHRFQDGRHLILDDVSMSLYRGETLGIIGRNGSGKTSILRLLGGIIRPTTGRVLRKSGTTSALLTIGLGFKPQLSGRDNALLAAMFQGATRRKAESCLEGIKEFSELGDSFEEPVKTYSSGMLARLGFTTALLTEVDVLLIDEILSVGDAHFRAKAEAALTDRIMSEQTVVFVSHSDAQIEKICNRVVWLSDARIAAEASSSFSLLFSPPITVYLLFFLLFRPFLASLFISRRLI